MYTHEMKKALDEAEATFRACDNLSDDFARAIAGRLRRVSSYNLIKLKKELEDFNMKTRCWKK